MREFGVGRSRPPMKSWSRQSPETEQEVLSVRRDHMSLAQPHRTHVLSPQGLATHRHPLRQARHHLCRRRRACSRHQLVDLIESRAQSASAHVSDQGFKRIPRYSGRFELLDDCGGEIGAVEGLETDAQLIENYWYMVVRFSIEGQLEGQLSSDHLALPSRNPRP